MSVILLNLVLCGLVIRPVPIEPSEKAKLKKKEIAKLKDSIKKNDLFFVKSIEAMHSQINLENEKSETHLKLSALDSISAMISSQNRVADLSEKFQNFQKEEQNRNRRSFKEIIACYFEYTLFYDFVFVFFVASNFFTLIGFYTPYIFIVDQAISLGIQPKNADYLLSAIGIS